MYRVILLRLFHQTSCFFVLCYHQFDVEQLLRFGEIVKGLRYSTLSFISTFRQTFHSRQFLTSKFVLRADALFWGKNQSNHMKPDLPTAGHQRLKVLHITTLQQQTLDLSIHRGQSLQPSPSPVNTPRCSFRQRNLDMG